MRLGEKLAHLREVEGQVRGLGRPLTKAEVVRLMRAETGEGMSQAYLSQLESGARIHLSAHSRGLLARFFKVHPGYLVADPPGYQSEIAVAHLLPGHDLRDWLVVRADEQRDPLVQRVLLRLAQLEDPRRLLAVLDDLLAQPVEQLELALTRALVRAGRADSAEGVIQT